MQFILPLALTALAFAQFINPQPDRFRGLVIDQSTPEDALRILGTPSDEKTGAFGAPRIDSQLSKDRKNRTFRHLIFKRVADMNKVTLTFSASKLVGITLDLDESLSPNILSKTYGIDFRPSFSSWDEALSPGQFERHQGKLYAKKYPTVYYLIAKSDRSFVSAMVTNNSFKSILGPDDPDSLPGKVTLIYIVSRTLENRDGADILK